jgi:hypothetical protein
MLAFAVLEAWPGRGFWQGRLDGRPGALSAGISSMAAMRQPALLHGLVSGASSLVASHGFAVNLGVVIVLAAAGGCLLTGLAPVARPAALVAIVLCLADWIFVQDLGFLGGLGTDPNSMVPQALLLAAGVVAMTPAAAPPAAAVPAPAPTPAPATTAHAYSVSDGLAEVGIADKISRGGLAPLRARRLPGAAIRRLGVALGTASTSSVLTLWAAAMVLLGAVPMALEFARPI